MYSSTLQALGNLNSTLLLNNVEETEKPLKLQFEEQVCHFQFSPFEESNELALVVFCNEILISKVKFQEHDRSFVEPLSYKELQSIEICNIHTVCWSPESSLNNTPYKIIFACVRGDGMDFSIKVFSTNIVSEPTEVIICGHFNYINAIAYEPSGNFFASVSDDLSCKVWEVKAEYSECASFNLLSPGMAVCWHKTNAGILVVGEKCGTVRMYNVTRNVALMSFQCDLGPLSSIAWLPGDISYLAALCGSHLVVWRTTSPSCPESVMLVHSEGGRHLCFAPGCGSSSIKLLSIGAPNYMLKSTSIDKGHSVNIASLKLASNISSHCNLPYIAVGVDDTVHFWRTTDL